MTMILKTGKTVICGSCHCLSLAMDAGASVARDALFPEHYSVFEISTYSFSKWEDRWAAFRNPS